MTLFSETFLSVLVIGALVWTALGILILLGLLFRDFRKRNIW